MNRRITTKQMQDAPIGAVYIWPNGLLDYPKKLSKELGRSDLLVVSLSWLQNGGWVGRELTGLVVDHSMPYSEGAMTLIAHASTRVRHNVEFSGVPG